MQAMILAAGFGTRLRPFSLQRPKPLFPVLGKPLLMHTIECLRQSGFKRIIVNAHYLQEQIADFLADEEDVVVQLEDAELGTGGGLRQALPLLGKEPVLITNGDIFHDIDYRRAYADHCAHGAPISMVMHDYPRFNKVGVDARGMIIKLPGQKKFISSLPLPTPGCSMAFTGIHVASPEVLNLIPEAGFYNIIDCYAQHLAANGEIQAIKSEGHYWQDIGTPRDYLDLHGYLLQSCPCPVGHRQLAPGCYVAEGSVLGEDVSFADWAYIGKNVTVCAGSHLERVVVWDEAEVEPGSVVRDEIVIR